MLTRIVLVVALVLGQYGHIESFHGHNNNSSNGISFFVRSGLSRWWYRERPSCFKPSFLYSPDQHQQQQQQQQQQSHHHQQFPIPAMPSDNFRKMAQSQLELLANSLTRIDHPSVGKVQSMILYLPQENSYSGQLEFTPAVLYPDPSTERVFIASDAASGQAPTLPKSLSKLPGFSSAPELLPGYPMLPSTTDPGVGVVEEVLCDIRFKTSALSVPLLSGCQTVGVLLVSPTAPLGDTKNGSTNGDGNGDNTWTKRDKQQVSLAAQSLSMALNMDNERKILSEQNTLFRENLSDSLHQMKNPIQALRTYGKILQRQIVETSIHNDNNNEADVGGSAQLLELAERLMVQSDRVVDMLGPMDSLVEALDSPVMLPPAVNGKPGQSMVLWNDQSQPSSNKASLYFNTTIETGDVGSTALPATTPSAKTTIARKTGAKHANSPNEKSAGLQATVIGDFETEMVFITDVLEPVFDTFRAIASENGIAFEVLVDDIDDLPGVFVAPKSFREAASNVLDNALKYAVLPKSGSPFSRNPSPSVKVRIFPNDHCHSGGNGSSSETTTTPGVTVLVEDNGPGVAQHDRHLIFERGFRSDRTASEVEGQGIGLDISWALLARMGGYLGLADENNELLSQFPDRLDGATMILEVTRKPYKSPGR